MSERRGIERLRWLQEMETIPYSGSTFELPRHQSMQSSAVAIEVASALIEELHDALAVTVDWTK